MAVHDGGIRADAEAVRRLHRLDPLRRRRLLRADDLADAVREDFRPAARQAVEAVFLEQRQDLADALARHLGEVDNLNRCERLDVCIWQRRFDLPHDGAVIRERLVGMQRRDDVDLRQVRRLLGLSEDALDVIGLHHKAACIACLHLEGAERTVRAADIRQVDVAVDGVVDAAAALALLRLARAVRQEQQVIILVERQGIFDAQPLPHRRSCARRFDLLHIYPSHSMMRKMLKLQSQAAGMRPASLMMRMMLSSLRARGL